MSLSVSHKNLVDTPAGGDGKDVSGRPEVQSVTSGSEVQAESPSRKVSATFKPSIWALERRLCRRLLQALGDPPTRLILWDGEEIAISKEAADSPSNYPRPAYAAAADSRSQYQFGEAYSNRHLEVDGDLGAFLELMYRARLRPSAGEAFAAKNVVPAFACPAGRTRLPPRGRTYIGITTSATIFIGSGWTGI